MVTGASLRQIDVTIYIDLARTGHTCQLGQSKTSFFKGAFCVNFESLSLLKKLFGFPIFNAC